MTSSSQADSQGPNFSYVSVMGVITVVIVLVALLLIMFGLVCGYVYSELGRGYGQGVFLTGRGVPYVALLELTHFWKLPLALASDLGSPPKAWITGFYASASQMSATEHLHELPSWAFYVQGFTH